LACASNGSYHRTSRIVSHEEGKSASHLFIQAVFAFTRLQHSILSGSPDEPYPVGVFPHQGSWHACGGNAGGTSHCLGNGNCGPNCMQCGASTHWTCCGCPYPSSIMCLSSLSLPQAIRNAFLFRSCRPDPTPCHAIPGISLPPAPPLPPPSALPPVGPQCNICIAARDEYNASIRRSCLSTPVWTTDPAPDPVCLHLQLKALTFITPLRGDTWRLWQQQQQQQQQQKLQQQQQQQPCLLDRLNDDLLGKVFAHLADSSQDYSRSLLSVTRLCSVYRRANVFEKTFQYGHLVLGCSSAFFPPPSWFQERRARISSVTAPLLPPGPLANVLATWVPQRYTFNLKILDSGFARARFTVVGFLSLFYRSFGR
jgi:hypothetical protein